MSRASSLILIPSELSSNQLPQQCFFLRIILAIYMVISAKVWMPPQHLFCAVRYGTSNTGTHCPSSKMEDVHGTTYDPSPFCVEWTKKWKNKGYLSITRRTIIQYPVWLESLLWHYSISLLTVFINIPKIKHELELLCCGGVFPSISRSPTPVPKSWRKWLPPS